MLSRKRTTNLGSNLPATMLVRNKPRSPRKAPTASMMKSLIKFRSLNKNLTQRRMKSNSAKPKNKTTVIMIMKMMMWMEKKKLKNLPNQMSFTQARVKMSQTPTYL
jgi:hypothetical protein